ncbi:MAG: hypothetical protein NTZ05_02695 [Chloroflexi bacterium]|nr:hypothetical protein [Chloroflexota bacterium]
MESANYRFFEDTGGAAPTIILPAHMPASEEEKARRRELGRESDRLAKLVGPLGTSSSDLIRQIRDEAEGLWEEEELSG